MPTESAAPSPDTPDAIIRIDAADWDGGVAPDHRAAAVAALESGGVLLFPGLAFALEPAEERFVTPEIASPRSKNVSFNPATGGVKGAVVGAADLAAIGAMMRRYYERTRRLVASLSPQYAAALEDGRTSYRPVEIAGRPSSVRRDDARLHVDAFVSTPTRGDRIMRVFSNVNRQGRGRHWQIGAPFPEVAGTFLPRLPAQMPGSAWLLRLAGVTRRFRTPYDHLMLKLHDTMKADTDYQRQVPRSDFDFPPGATWITYTDMVSHAVLSGQYMFEQTFYLPTAALADESKAPLRVLERLSQRALV
jgi:hypothetical protein